MREDRSASGNTRIGRIQPADASLDRRGLPRFVSGVLNVDKAAGETSFQVVRKLRHLTGAHRVGHAGTLDPLATGVLPILFESATRLAEFAHQLPKTYVADIHLGFSTATDDAEAEKQVQGDPSGLTIDDVSQALAHFTGRILQEPPAFSAVKIEGERAYRLARRGEEPKPPAREVEVYEARVLDFAPGPQAVARVEIRCGSGTYLRSIARDLGRQLGVGGYLGRLVRTAYGPLTVETAMALGAQTSAEDVRDPSASTFRRGAWSLLCTEPRFAAPSCLRRSSAEGPSGASVEPDRPRRAHDRQL
jgi:tRNA pseudouridine55 synthase